MNDDIPKIRFNDSVSTLVDLMPSESWGRLISSGTTRWDLPGDMMVYGFNAVSLDHKWTRATALVRHENVRMVRLKMASGTSFSVGIDHPLLAYSDGKISLIDPVRSKRLCLPTIRRFARCYPVKDTVLASGPHGRGGVLRNHVLPLNYRTGLFIGLLLGDGCVTNGGQLYLYGSGWKTRNRKFFASIAASGDLPYAGISCITRFLSKGLGAVATMRTRTVIVNQGWFSLWLKEQIGSGALSKRIPEFCFNAPQEHLSGVFDGLISSDGSVSVSRGKQKPQLLVSFSTSSSRLVEDFKRLCERLTLRCSVSDYQSRQSGRVAYIINISTRDLARAHERHDVSFVHPEKNAIFRRWIGHVVLEGPGVTGDHVPYPLELDRALRQTYAWSNNFKQLPCGKTYFGPFPVFKSKGRWDRGTALKYVEALSGFKSWKQASPECLAILRDRSIGWDKVVEVAPLRDLGTAWAVVVPGADAIALEGGLLIPTFPQSPLKTAH